MSKKRNRNQQQQAAPQEPTAQQVRVEGSEGNDGEYTAQAAAPTQPAAATAGIAELITMDNIKQAAREIASYKPESIRLRDRDLRVDKLPAERFEELAPQLLQDFGPYVGLTPQGEDAPPRPATPLDWARLLLKHYPPLAGWLIQACCTEPDGSPVSDETVRDLYFDEKLLLLAACIVLSFVANGGLRVFFGGGLAAAHSALKEGAASRR